MLSANTRLHVEIHNPLRIHTADILVILDTVVKAADEVNLCEQDVATCKGNDETKKVER